ncbi:hypothetical protein M9H77_30961 [Catharanthus roseus]|uniref:Uncharacterized protein n=1 Tax=Catharanthus roseus TaxID=4058 RepID=A0ACC0A0T2_CATRO|nr:hypothetical protein M9H77_30961 [Catharanthus roseus]
MMCTILRQEEQEGRPESPSSAEAAMQVYATMSKSKRTLRPPPPPQSVVHLPKPPCTTAYTKNQERSYPNCYAQNAYTEGQYNTPRDPHSRSNRICARAVLIRHQGQWALDARVLALLPSTLIIVSDTVNIYMLKLKIFK